MLEALVRLATPPIPCVVPAAVFDEFSWIASTTLDWRRPRTRPFDVSTPLDGSDPTRMVFVFHAACDFLPRELAGLHATGLGLESEWALAPYAIDDATDQLHARRIEPRSLLWLAADNLNALYWGLHDWSHFHNHGPFTERAWTELQCDAAALSWLRCNRDAIALDDATDARLTREVKALSAKRFADEGKPCPALDVLDRER
ncbi:hypothetical protein BH09MYX1_BH09MYX1_04380 [soil metagenome]